MSGANGYFGIDVGLTNPKTAQLYQINQYGELADHGESLSCTCLTRLIYLVRECDRRNWLHSYVFESYIFEEELTKSILDLPTGYDLLDSSSHYRPFTLPLGRLGPNQIVTIEAPDQYLVEGVAGTNYPSGSYGVVRSCTVAPDTHGSNNEILTCIDGQASSGYTFYVCPRTDVMLYYAYYTKVPSTCEAVQLIVENAY
jgi:hypothetical protein